MNKVYLSTRLNTPLVPPYSPEIASKELQEIEEMLQERSVDKNVRSIALGFLVQILKKESFGFAIPSQVGGPPHLLITRLHGKPIEVLPLDQNLEEGGFGKVHKVAFKSGSLAIVKLAKKLDHEYLRTVQEEQKVLEKLTRENKVSHIQEPPFGPVYTFVEEKYEDELGHSLFGLKNCGFIGPYYELGDLHQWIDSHSVKEGSLPLEKAGQILKTLTKTVLELKQLGLFHTDIKSANVLLKKEQEPLLGDLSIASLSKEAHSIPDFIYTKRYTPLPCVYSIQRFRDLLKQLTLEDPFDRKTLIAFAAKEFEKITISQLGIIAYELYYGHSTSLHWIYLMQKIDNKELVSSEKNSQEEEIKTYIQKMIAAPFHPEMTLESVLDTLQKAFPDLAASPLPEIKTPAESIWEKAHSTLQLLWKQSLPFFEWHRMLTKRLLSVF
jgi:serine/threonine protein kinase